ncbi:MAG TPA: ATP-binding protein [Clostridiales bacterium]|nr:ATP-binding protein [Clostridiales bacterium]
MKLKFSGGRPVKDSRTEFMPILNDKLEKEVISFLNSDNGGDVLVGISYDGAVLGVDSYGDVLHVIADRLRVNISPSCLGLIDVVPVTSGGKTFIRVIVARGTEQPYYLRLVGKSSAGCFCRKDGIIRQMDTERIKELSGNKDLSAMNNIVSPRNAEHTFALLRIYYEEKGIRMIDDIRKTLDLYTEEGKLNYAAYLLSDSNSTSFKIIKYAGTERTEMTETNEYGGSCLIRSADKILDKLEVENRTFTVRTENDEIKKNRLVKPEVLKEVFLNALLHNDYSRDIMPEIEIFSDKIAVTSFGKLPGQLDDNSFCSGFPIPRNRELIRVFKDLGYTGELGSGIDNILESYDSSIFKINDNSLEVVLPFAEEFKMKSSGKSKAEKIHIRTRDRIIEIMKKDPSVTAVKLAVLTGVSRKAVEWHLKKMRNSGIVKREGSRKTGFWIIRV